MRTAVAQGDSINQILPILAVALDHIPIGIVIVRDDGRIRFANNIARNIAKDGGLVLDNNLLSASRKEERELHQESNSQRRRGHHPSR
ncbi:MAG: hypothetical protein CMF63_00585 [Magnetovibrio sp.]|jgi:PAS domain-containing protein|nr:hypothetical protein [Magnetovibrio sp.]